MKTFPFRYTDSLGVKKLVGTLNLLKLSYKIYYCDCPQGDDVVEFPIFDDLLVYFL
jgi:hypothetical protein